MAETTTARTDDEPDAPGLQRSLLAAASLRDRRGTADRAAVADRRVPVT
jgi:hypothetical protein